MKKKLFLAVVVVLVIALVIWAFMPRPVEVQAVGVTKGAFERSVQEDGQTRLRNRYTVSAPLSGQVQRITLREGDTVKRGAIVAVLLPSAPGMLDARTQSELRARAGTAEANLARSKVEVERARAALAQSRNELVRSEALAKQGFVSPNQTETERLNAVLREKELARAEQDVHATGHDLEQTQAALRQYTQAGSTGAVTPWEIRSPVSGKVLKVAQQSEGSVPAGAPLLEIGDPHDLEVVADILTSDAAQISPGMQVKVYAGEALSTLDGRVWRVEPAAFTKVSALGVEEQRVNVVIDIVTPPEKWLRLGDGFRTDVSVTLSSVPDALKVPVGAVFPKNGGYAVFVVDAGRAREKDIEVIARNQTEVQIARGVEPGAQVIVYPPSTLKESARVAPRK